MANRVTQVAQEILVLPSVVNAIVTQVASELVIAGTATTIGHGLTNSTFFSSEVESNNPANGIPHGGYNNLLIRLLTSQTIPNDSQYYGYRVLSAAAPVQQGRWISFGGWVKWNSNANLPIGVYGIQRVGVIFYDSAMNFISESYIDLNGGNGGANPMTFISSGLLVNGYKNQYCFQTGGTNYPAGPGAAPVPANAAYVRFQCAAFISNYGASPFNTSGSLYMDCRFDDCWAINQIDPKSHILSQGSIVPTLTPTVLQYTSTTTSITFTWKGLVLYRPDGSTTAIPNGSQAITALQASHQYLFFPYYDEDLQTVQWVPGGIGSPAIAFPYSNGGETQLSRSGWSIAAVSSQIFTSGGTPTSLAVLGGPYSVPGSYWSATAQTGWIIIDMGQPTTFDMVSLQNRPDSPYYWGSPLTFEVWVSSDNITYTQVSTFTNPNPTSPGAMNNYQLPSAQTARYLKINVLSIYNTGGPTNTEVCIGAITVSLLQGGTTLYTYIGQAQTMSLVNHVPLSPTMVTAATQGTVGGGGGTVGGYGRVCLRGSMIVMSRKRGPIPIKEVFIGEEILGRCGWTLVTAKLMMENSTWIRFTLDHGARIDATPTHPFTLPDLDNGTDQIKRAMDISMYDMFYVRTGIDHIKSIEHIEEDDLKVTLTCEPDHEFYAGEAGADILTHNFQFMPS